MAVTHTPARQPPEDPSLVRFHFDIMESICGFIHGEKRGSIARVGTPARHFAHLVFCVPEGDVQQLTETVWLCPPTTQQDQRWNPHAEARSHLSAPSVSVFSTLEFSVPFVECHL